MQSRISSVTFRVSLLTRSARWRGRQPRLAEASRGDGCGEWKREEKKISKAGSLVKCQPAESRETPIAFRSFYTYNISLRRFSSFSACSRYLQWPGERHQEDASARSRRRRRFHTSKTTSQRKRSRDGGQPEWKTPPGQFLGFRNFFLSKGYGHANGRNRGGTSMDQHRGQFYTIISLLNSNVVLLKRRFYTHAWMLRCQIYLYIFYLLLKGHSIEIINQSLTMKKLL